MRNASKLSVLLPSSRSGALALALLVALFSTVPSAAFADGGSRRGGARRSPPPPPPQSQAPRQRMGPSLSAPAPRQMPASSALPRAYAPRENVAQRVRTAPQTAGGGAPVTGPFVGARPIQRSAPAASGLPAGTPWRTGSSLGRGTLPSAAALPRATLPRATLPPAGALQNPGTRTTRLPQTGPTLRPPVGTGASPTWDSRLRTRPTADPAARLAQPSTPLADPRRLQARPVTTSPQTTLRTGGVRRSGALVAPGVGGSSPALASHTGGVRYGGGSPALAAHTGGVRYGGGSRALSTHVGGVHYGGASHHHGHGHLHGGYGYGAYGYGSGYGCGSGWGWGWGGGYPYSSCGTSLVIGFWGFGGGYCEPTWVAPPAYWPSEPLGYGPAYVMPTPTYVVPAPTYVQPPEYPLAPEEAAPVWPEPNTAPSPEPGPLPEPQPEATQPEQPQGPAPGETQELQLTPEEGKALGQSLEAFRREAYDEAQNLLEPLVVAKPELGHAWMGIAHAAFAAGRTKRAAEAITKVAQLGGFPRGYKFDPAALYASPEAFRGRKDALAAQLAAQPDDSDARLVNAWLLVSLGERAAAREQLDLVLGLRPADEAAPILSLALLPPLPMPPPTQPAGPPAAPAQPPVPQPLPAPGAGR